MLTIYLFCIFCSINVLVFDVVYKDMAMAKQLVSDKAANFVLYWVTHTENRQTNQKKET